MNESNESNLIKSEENGVEFYTVIKTGRAGISQSGLAKLCGVTRPSIINYAKTLVTSIISQNPELSAEEAYKSLTLVTRGEKAVIDDKEVGNLKVYSADFCIEAIKYYSEKGNKKAVFSLTKFAGLGFDTWVQQITGWQSPQLDQPPLKSLPPFEPQTIDVTAQSVPAQPIQEEVSIHPSLKFISDAIALGEKLGGFDSKQQAIVRFQLMKAIQLSKLVKEIEEESKPEPIPASEGDAKTFLTLSEIAAKGKLRLTPEGSSIAGKQAAHLYRQRHGDAPLQRLGYFKGKPCHTNVYSQDDGDIAVSALRELVDQGEYGVHWYYIEG